MNEKDFNADYRRKRGLTKRWRGWQGQACYLAVITTPLLHTIAAVAWATVAVGLAAAAVTGRKGRLLEMQLATDPEKLRALVQGDPQRVGRLKRALLLDYGFLALYWLTFRWDERRDLSSRGKALRRS